VALTTFGVTPAIVRQQHFPHRSDFSTVSNPTTATVTVFINQAAADVQGWLLKESIDAASITDSATAPYVKCAEAVTLRAAIKVQRAATNDDPAIAKALEAELKAWRKALEDDGATFLGDDSLGDGSNSDPDGPTTHISELDLDTGDDADASDVVPVLRRSDDL
jgi:hypothetical protein